MPDETATPDLTDLIEAEAALPKKSESDGQSAEARPLTELIAADKYLKSKDAAARGSAWGRIKMARAVPPGGVQ